MSASSTPVLSSARVVLYDIAGDKPWPEMTDSWKVGARLYLAARRVDVALPISSWAEAAEKLRQFSRVDMLQLWGHGRPGAALCGKEELTPEVLRAFPSIGTLWLRSCSTFHGPVGKAYAERLADATKGVVAGHTFLIGMLQSGLRTLKPGETPAWRDDEGYKGLAANGRRKTRGSLPWHPRTITCLHAEIPAGW